MEEFIKSDIDTNKLKMLNKMGMSIKAIALSDICDADGWNFTTSAWLLQGSNGLRDDHECPRNPPKWIIKSNFGKNLCIQFLEEDTIKTHQDALITISNLEDGLMKNQNTDGNAGIQSLKIAFIWRKKTDGTQIAQEHLLNFEDLNEQNWFIMNFIHQHLNLPPTIILQILI